MRPKPLIPILIAMFFSLLVFACWERKELVI
jgi:hypothetical protein